MSTSIKHLSVALFLTLVIPAQGMFRNDLQEKQEDERSGIIAEAFHQVNGNPISKQKIREELPDDVQYHIGTLFTARCARHTIKEATQFVSDHCYELIPALTYKFMTSERHEANAHCDDLVSGYSRDPNKIEYDHPIVLGGYSMTFGNVGILPSNAEYRDITKVSELLGAQLTPGQVVMLQYSNNTRRYAICERDRQALVKLSQKQKDFIVSLAKQKILFCTGRIYIEKKLTPQEWEIFKSLNKEMQQNLSRYYGLHNSRAFITASYGIGIAKRPLLRTLATFACLAACYKIGAQVKAFLSNR